MIETSAYESLLLRRRSALARRLKGSETQLSSAHSKDWEDQAVEREPEEVIETLSDADREEMRGIYAALLRIRDGDFGECVSCGNPISEARLLVLPATPFCRMCARQTDVDIFENVPV